MRDMCDEMEALAAAESAAERIKIRPAEMV